MAGNSTTQDRTEKPTPKRLRDARKRGQVPRSRELSTAAVVGVAVMMLSSGGARMGRAALQLMREGLQIDPVELLDPGRVVVRFASALRFSLLAVSPVLVGTVFAALLAPWLLGGWNFSASALKPDFSRINPLSGLARMVSLKALVELAKSVAKSALIGVIGALYVMRHLNEISVLGLEAPTAAAIHLLRMTLSVLLWMTAALLLIALLDAPYQRWSYMKQLRMTRQEVRDELKESEGRPEIKARVRRQMQQMAQKRMMEKVPGADVVVTNPTHYAVALQYTAGKMRAPVVVAKGAGEIAATIRQLAREHRVPLLSSPPLARALYRSVNLDREIPVALYAAVAQVLTYVYQLRSWRGGTPPAVPNIDHVPGGDPDPE